MYYLISNAKFSIQNTTLWHILNLSYYFVTNSTKIYYEHFLTWQDNCHILLNMRYSALSWEEIIEILYVHDFRLIPGITLSAKNHLSWLLKFSSNAEIVSNIYSWTLTLNPENCRVDLNLPEGYKGLNTQRYLTMWNIYDLHRLP